MNNSCLICSQNKRRCFISWQFTSIYTIHQKFGVSMIHQICYAHLTCIYLISVTQSFRNYSNVLIWCSRKCAFKKNSARLTEHHILAHSIFWALWVFDNWRHKFNSVTSFMLTLMMLVWILYHTRGHLCTACKMNNVWVCLTWVIDCRAKAEKYFSETTFCSSLYSIYLCHYTHAETPMHLPLCEPQIKTCSFSDIDVGMSRYLVVNSPEGFLLFVPCQWSSQ